MQLSYDLKYVRRTSLVKYSYWVTTRRENTRTIFRQQFTYPATAVGNSDWRGALFRSLGFWHHRG